MKTRSNRFWLCLLGALLALSLGGAWLLRGLTAPGTVAVITLDGAEVERVDLSAVTREYTLSFTGERGLTNVLQVVPGNIRVLEADCPDQVCVHQGWIGTGAAPIVCLPNQLVIKLENAPRGGLDGVVGK